MFKQLFLLPLLFLAVSCAQQETPAEPILKSGRYVGMDYMGKQDVTPDDSTDRWYHENTVTVKADSLFLESVPVVFYKNQPKAYSSSDGGFYSYKGKVYGRGNQIIAKLLVTNHDYVMIPYKTPKSMESQAKLNISFDEKIKRGIYVWDSTFLKEQWRVVASPKGFTMDGVAYSRVTKR
ncbi:hypothetical protein JAO73_21315 [Hymenobacter sp. BT523]|uniref:hypothetical protein n=1 Tax=Hymenobacter sp. BT523 TaxID=2795725 RepID=UPI0018EB0741|nr:hypothetical protein [Hymenobacter sp. BT523]MBJ6111575.1 hypothetical protein [Hymenobacter sp. BT523]